MKRTRRVVVRGMSITKRPALVAILLAVCALVAAGRARAGDDPVAEQPLREAPRLLDPGEGRLGERVDLPPFTDLEGRAGTLAGVIGEQGLVIVTHTRGCPASRRYAPRVEALRKEFEPRGFGFLMLNPAEQDDDAELRETVETVGIGTRYVHDADRRLARVLQVRTTTEVFVLDRAHTLVYRGAVDDQYGLGYALAAPRHNYLRDALAAVLDGRQPEVQCTSAPGCVLDVGEPPAGTGGVTYHGRISRILDRHCVECHRDGENGPFTLDTYADAKGNAPMIRQVIERGLMPPWFAAPHVGGPWRNDRSLSARDRAALLDWIAGGCPAGDRSEAPVPIARATGWRIGEPDLVLSPAKPFPVPAEGVVPYRFAQVETRLEEDRWVRAFEIRPSAPEVVHHVLVFIRFPKDDPRWSQRPADLEGVAGYFAGMVPGQGHVIYPEGYAKLLPKGAILRFQIHYTPNGNAKTDLPRLGLIFAEGPPKYEVRTQGVFNVRFEIPPGAPNHEVSGTWMFPKPSRILGFMPHMHLRGKAARYELAEPFEEERVVLDVPRYDFNWQLAYWLRDPLDVPARTMVRATGWFDNSAANPANPDPGKAVRFGQQTFDEMMIGYVEYVETGE